MKILSVLFTPLIKGRISAQRLQCIIPGRKELTVQNVRELPVQCLNLNTGNKLGFIDGFNQHVLINQNKISALIHRRRNQNQILGNRSRIKGICLRNQNRGKRNDITVFSFRNVTKCIRIENRRSRINDLNLHIRRRHLKPTGPSRAFIECECHRRGCVGKIVYDHSRGLTNLLTNRNLNLRTNSSGNGVYHCVSVGINRINTIGILQIYVQFGIFRKQSIPLSRSQFRQRLVRIANLNRPVTGLGNIGLFQNCGNRRELGHICPFADSLLQRLEQRLSIYVIEENGKQLFGFEIRIADQIYIHIYLLNSRINCLIAIPSPAILCGITVGQSSQFGKRFQHRVGINCHQLVIDVVVNIILLNVNQVLQSDCITGHHIRFTEHIIRTGNIIAVINLRAYNGVALEACKELNLLPRILLILTKRLTLCIISTYNREGRDLLGRLGTAIGQQTCIGSTVRINQILVYNRTVGEVRRKECSTTVDCIIRIQRNILQREQRIVHILTGKGNKRLLVTVLRTACEGKCNLYKLSITVKQTDGLLVINVVAVEVESHRKVNRTALIRIVERILFSRFQIHTVLIVNANGLDLFLKECGICSNKTFNLVQKLFAEYEFVNRILRSYDQIMLRISVELNRNIQFQYIRPHNFFISPFNHPVACRIGQNVILITSVLTNNVNCNAVIILFVIPCQNKVIYNSCIADRMDIGANNLFPNVIILMHYVRGIELCNTRRHSTIGQNHCINGFHRCTVSNTVLRPKKLRLDTLHSDGTVFIKLDFVGLYYRILFDRPGQRDILIDSHRFGNKLCICSSVHPLDFCCRQRIIVLCILDLFDHVRNLSSTQLFTLVYNVRLKRFAKLIYQRYGYKRCLGRIQFPSNRYVLIENRIRRIKCRTCFSDYPMDIRCGQFIIILCVLDLFDHVRNLSSTQLLTLVYNVRLKRFAKLIYQRYGYKRCHGRIQLPSNRYILIENCGRGIKCRTRFSDHPLDVRSGQRIIVLCILDLFDHVRDLSSTQLFTLVYNVRLKRFAKLIYQRYGYKRCLGRIQFPSNRYVLIENRIRRIKCRTCFSDYPMDIRCGQFIIILCVLDLFDHVRDLSSTQLLTLVYNVRLEYFAKLIYQRYDYKRCIGRIQLPSNRYVLIENRIRRIKCRTRCSDYPVDILCGQFIISLCDLDLCDHICNLSSVQLLTLNNRVCLECSTKLIYQRYGYVFNNGNINIPIYSQIRGNHRGHITRGTIQIEPRNVFIFKRNTEIRSYDLIHFVKKICQRIAFNCVNRSNLMLGIIGIYDGNRIFLRKIQFPSQGNIFFNCSIDNVKGFAGKRLPNDMLSSQFIIVLCSLDLFDHVRNLSSIQLLTLVYNIRLKRITGLINQRHVHKRRFGSIQLPADGNILVDNRIEIKRCTRCRNDPVNIVKRQGVIALCNSDLCKHICNLGIAQLLALGYRVTSKLFAGLINQRHIHYRRFGKIERPSQCKIFFNGVIYNVKYVTRKRMPYDFLCRQRNIVLNLLDLLDHFVDLSLTQLVTLIQRVLQQLLMRCRINNGYSHLFLQSPGQGQIRLHRRIDGKGLVIRGVYPDDLILIQILTGNLFNLCDHLCKLILQGCSVGNIEIFQNGITGFGINNGYIMANLKTPCQIQIRLNQRLHITLGLACVIQPNDFLILKGSVFRPGSYERIQLGKIIVQCIPMRNFDHTNKLRSILGINNSNQQLANVRNQTDIGSRHFLIMLVGSQRLPANEYLLRIDRRIILHQLQIRTCGQKRRENFITVFIIESSLIHSLGANRRVKSQYQRIIGEIAHEDICHLLQQILINVLLGNDKIDKLVDRLLHKRNRCHINLYINVERTVSLVEVRKRKMLQILSITGSKCLLIQIDHTALCCLICIFIIFNDRYKCLVQIFQRIILLCGILQNLLCVNVDSRLCGNLIKNLSRIAIGKLIKGIDILSKLLLDLLAQSLQRRKLRRLNRKISRRQIREILSGFFLYIIKERIHVALGHQFAVSFAKLAGIHQLQERNDLIQLKAFNQRAHIRSVRIKDLKQLILQILQIGISGRLQLLQCLFHSRRKL